MPEPKIKSKVPIIDGLIAIGTKIIATAKVIYKVNFFLLNFLKKYLNKS